MRKFLIGTLFCILLYSGVQGTPAKTWIEDFNQGDLKSWIKHDPNGRTTWQAKGGHLDVWLEPFHHQVLRGADYELVFIGFPLKAEKLTVKVTILDDQNASAGIFIGQFNDRGSISRRTYKFFQGGIWEPIEFAPQLPNNPFAFGQSAAKNEIKIVFNKGDFQVVSDGKHIIDFHEPNLPTVDCLGIIVHAIPPLGHVVLDDFIISGPSIPSNGSMSVCPKDKATVLWGELKRQ